MPPKVIPLSKSGLVEVEEAAKRLKAAARTVQKWIADGLLPVHSVGGGMVYLIREADLKKFVRPKMGRPAKPDSPR